jgi:hypothetical protein
MGSRGSSTVLALAIMALLCVVFSGLLGVVGAQQKAGRAQVLADLAALPDCRYRPGCGGGKALS